MTEISRVQSKQIGNNVHVNLSFFSENPGLLNRVDAFLGAVLELFKARELLPNERVDELIKANSDLVTRGRVDAATIDHLHLLIDDEPTLRKIFREVEDELPNIENEEKQAKLIFDKFMRVFIAEAINCARKQYDVKTD